MNLFFFPDVIWANLHDPRSNKWVLNYVWSPLMGRSLFGKCDLINYWVCFLWQIERHSPPLALHILLIRGDKIDFRPEKKQFLSENPHLYGELSSFQSAAPSNLELLSARSTIIKDFSTGGSYAILFLRWHFQAKEGTARLAPSRGLRR